MPKSKSKKNKDFQKVKLKVGRKLQKADNVTNTSFKTRTVQVSQQLKVASSDSGSRKQYNLTDLFIQCRHYNSHVRLDAVTHMKEHFTSLPDDINSHLAAVLERISELFVDKDSLVRNANLRLSKYVLPLISAKQVSPFFPLLSAHLSCAMTDIDDDVRLDSLPLFDLFLDLYPSHVLNTSNKILPNFIEQISSRKNKASNSGWSERSLATNPDSKTSTLKWRTSVLNRIQKLLRVMLEHLKKKSHEHVEGDHSFIIRWNSEGTPFQSFPTYIRNNWQQGMPFSLSSSDNVNKQKDIGSTDMKDLIGTLIPLLLACWVESSPTNLVSNKSGNDVPGNNVSLMYEVVVVLELLLQCSVSGDSNDQQFTITELVEKYSKDIEQHFVRYFPYRLEETVNVKKKSGKIIQQSVSSEAFNLSICMSMAYFICEKTSCGTNFKPWLKKMKSYLSKIALKRKMSQEENRLLISVVKRLIKYFDEETLEQIFSALLGKLQNASRLSKDKMVLLEMFGELSSDLQNSHVISIELRSSFLASLPELFVRVISDNPQSATCVLTVMKKAACQKCGSFLDNLEVQFQSIYNEEVLLQLSKEWQRSLVDLIYYLDTLSRDQLKHLASLCFRTAIPEETIVYVISILDLKLWSTAEKPVDLSASINGIQFLFVLITGSTAETMNALQERKSDDCAPWGFQLHEEDADVQVRKQHIVKFICSVIELFPSNYQFAEVLNTFMSNILEQYTVFPLSSVYGLLYCWNLTRRVVENRILPYNIQDKLVDICHTVLDNLNEKQNVVSNETSGNILEAVWEEIRVALSKYVKGWPMFYSNILDALQDESDSSVIDKICYKAAMPLRNEETRLLFRNTQLCSQIQDICHLIKEKHTYSASSKIWNELNYLLSMTH